MTKPWNHLLDSAKFETPVLALSSGALTIDLPLNESYRHSFAALEFYNDAAGETPVPATAGTAIYTLVVSSSPSTFEEFADNQITLPGSSLVSWGANATSVRVALTSVTGVTHVRLRATCNIS